MAPKDVVSMQLYTIYFFKVIDAFYLAWLVLPMFFLVKYGGKVGQKKAVFWSIKSEVSNVPVDHSRNFLDSLLITSYLSIQKTVRGSAFYLINNSCKFLKIVI